MEFKILTFAWALVLCTAQRPIFPRYRGISFISPSAPPLVSHANAGQIVGTPLPPISTFAPVSIISHESTVSPELPFSQGSTIFTNLPVSSESTVSTVLPESAKSSVSTPELSVSTILPESSESTVSANISGSTILPTSTISLESPVTTASAVLQESSQSTMSTDLQGSSILPASTITPGLPVSTMSSALPKVSQATLSTTGSPILPESPVSTLSPMSPVLPGSSVSPIIAILSGSTISPVASVSPPSIISPVSIPNLVSLPPISSITSPLAVSLPSIHPVFPNVLSREQAPLAIDYDDGPSEYQFQYSVQSPETGDYKNQGEQRVGDAVRGSYSVLEPNGKIRIVDYFANDADGFVAVVRYEDAYIPGIPLYRK